MDNSLRCVPRKESSVKNGLVSARNLFNILILLLGVHHIEVCAQSTDYPLIGAQVFIEPGQSEAQIDGWFKTLKDHHFEVCRIRMFEYHMKRPDGSWDFKLFDQAFASAEKYGIRIFATLFPLDASGQMKSFKFPTDEGHASRIADYIDAVVNHYKGHPSLYAWVLINELGRSKLPMQNPYTRDRFEEWKSQNEVTTDKTEYIKLPYYEDEFFRVHNTSYLGWLAEAVRKHDPVTCLHVNTHAIHHILSEYEYQKWDDILDSHGSSLHPSWHFGDFDREQYALAVASANDIVREAGRDLPFWVTELQGGNNTASSVFPLCPTRDEIAQWLWTSVGSGAEGIIFWTLNPRAVGFEAGEWGLLDYTDQPSDRLEMAGRVSESILNHKSLFRDASPVQAKVHLLYNNESYYAEKQSFIYGGDMLGRNPHATILSLMSYYEALVQQGVTPQFHNIDYFSVEERNCAGEVAIVPNLICITQSQWEQLTRFVARGGKLIVSGLSGYYNQYAQCAFRLGEYPSEMLGACLTEFKVAGPEFPVSVDDFEPLPAHMWRGYLRCTDAKVIATHEGAVVGARNYFGKGEVVWIPSLLGLGAWKRDSSQFSRWLRSECQDAIDGLPFSFLESARYCQLRLLETDDHYVGVVTNSGSESRMINLQSRPAEGEPIVLFSTGNGSQIEPGSITINGHDTLVFQWAK